MAVIHTRAFILSTGDEIVTGQLQDTNARWLASRLLDLGIVPIAHAAAPDNLRDLVRAIRFAARRAPLVLMTGGLGPTDGDLTRAALAEVLGEPLVVDEGVKAELVARLTGRGREATERQLRQAVRPHSAACLPNRFGTAPGLHATLRAGGAHESADLFALPGPPGELTPMFEGSVVPLLRPPPGRTVRTRLSYVVGMAESDCVDRLGDLTRRDRVPLVGITASGGILTLRMRFEGAGDAAGAERALDEAESRARAALGDHVFAVEPRGTAGNVGNHVGGTGAYRLAEALLGELASRGRTLSTVESCTGGMLGGLLTSVPGSSAAYVGGFITYANGLKESLGVEAPVLARHGAVSAPVAEQMAACGLERAGSDYALAITGVAGPGGGSPGKPVGTVYIALAARGKGIGGGAGMVGGVGGAEGTQRVDEESTVTASGGVRRFAFTGDREDIRNRAAVASLAMLHFHLRGHTPGTPRLLWEVG